MLKAYKELTDRLIVDFGMKKEDEVIQPAVQPVQE
jgi:hypothetical protein